MSNNEHQPVPPVYPDIEDWPIYKLSEDRRNFVEEIESYTLDKMLKLPPSQARDLISKTIYQERIRIKEEPWKVDPPKEKQFWKRIGRRHIRLSLDTDPQQAAQSNRENLQQIIHRYAEEIVGTFKISTFLFARRFLTFFFTRLLNTAALRSIRGLWRKQHQLVDKLMVDRIIGFDKKA